MKYRQNFFVSLAVILLSVVPLARSTTLTIDTSTTYQTIRGWGCVNFLPEYLNPEHREDLIYEIVNGYGLNRMRVEIPAGSFSTSRRWEWLNDNTDPRQTDWSKLNVGDLDIDRVDKFVGPFAEYVRANGEPFDFYVSPSFYTDGSSGQAPEWLRDNPGEYTEYAMSMLLRMKYVHNIEADYMCILNEAGYKNGWSIAMVQDKIKTLGPVMEAAGLKTKIEFPESVAVDTAMAYIDQTAADDEMWSWVGVVSYHRYGAETRMGELSDFAVAKGLPTAFTEHSNTTLGRMYADLVVGNVSYWEVYAVGSEIDFSIPSSSYIQFLPKGYYWRFRQIFHYVRPGAIRVAATTDDESGTMLAWVKDGRTILNFWGIGGTLDIENLTPGTYGFCGSRLSAAYVEYGTRTVGGDGKLTVTGLDSSRVYTLYPHPGGNLPPTFTKFSASTGTVIAPTESVTLTAAADDTEKDVIGYLWEVTDVPTGANVLLATPNAANCDASGLTVPGVYTFTVTASDASGSTQRRVRCEAFAGNPPPKIFGLHNRIPVQVFLPTTYTLLRSSVWDANGDAITYQWSVFSQPAGANAQFATATEDRTDVTNLTVPGDYVFRLSISDGTTVVTEDLTIPVYPLNSQPTLTVGVNDPTITLPTATTTLTSVAIDPDGDPLTHWWRTKTKPAGAHPVFATPGQANTTVSGLIVPGSYTFEHIVADEFRRKSATVSMTVNPGSSPELLSVTAPRGGETYEPGQKVSIRWASANFSGNVKLEFFNGSAWSVLNASTTNDGIEAWTVPASQASGCLVRISDATDGVPFAESDAAFRIVGPDVFKIIKIDGDFVTGPTLTWSSLPGGVSYQVYYSESLRADDWHKVGPVHVAQSGEFDLSFTDTTATGKLKRFYRVIETVLE